jgi:hypothetical protein
MKKAVVLTSTTSAAISSSPPYADMWTIKYGRAVDHFYTCHSVLFRYSGSHRQDKPTFGTVLLSLIIQNTMKSAKAQFHLIYISFHKELALPELPHCRLISL